MGQSLNARNSNLARKGFGFMRAVLFAVAFAAFLASLFAQGESADVYRTAGRITLGAALLIALPFELLDGHRDRKAMKERARTMTALQRVSSGLNDRLSDQR
jgi:hypothetical protein